MMIHEFVVKSIRRIIRDTIFIATVADPATSGNKVYIIRPTATTADAQAYARLESYASPTAGDRVLVINVNGPLVIGKIIT